VEEAAATLETREVADAIVEQMQDEVGTHRLRRVWWGVVVATGSVGRTRPGVCLSHAPCFCLFVCCDAACLPLLVSGLRRRGARARECRRRHRGDRGSARDRGRAGQSYQAYPALT
jgi:hypothetical protein